MTAGGIRGAGRRERPWRTEFAKATAIFDWAKVDELTKDYVAFLYASPTLHDSVPAILLELREHLRFERLEEVADAALAHSPDQPGVRRQYAQALVDGGNQALAAQLYAMLEADPRASQQVKNDARGGIGRCNKEMYLLCTEPDRRAEFLRRAFDAYYRVYAADPTATYHGINAVALAARADQEDIDLRSDTPSARVLARRILDEVDAQPIQDPWSIVTAAEACVALGRDEDAIDRVGAFLQGRRSGFTIGAFLRQLTVMWELDTGKFPGDQILAMLRSALLAYQGGEVTVGPKDVRAARLDRLAENTGLEKILGADSYQTYQWYVTGLTRCRAVARLENRFGKPWGTGFLVAGRDLHPDLPERVLVTNAHVVPEALAVTDAVAAFHGLEADPGRRVEFAVARQLWSQPSAGLDTTILALEGYPDVEPIPLGADLPVLTEDSRARAYVIGHPRGLDQPQFSLHDNLLLDHDQRVLHYRSPTEGGSSGSPVMDDGWALIGLHHSGTAVAPRLNGKGGTYAANEGILVTAIRERLAEHPPLIS